MRSEAANTGSPEQTAHETQEGNGGHAVRRWRRIFDEPVFSSEQILARSWWYAATVGIFSALLALLARLPLLPALQLHLPYLTFFGSTTLAAYLGGLRAGVVATALGGFFASYFLILPRQSENPTFLEHAVGMALFSIIAVIVSVLFDSLHRARVRAEKLAHHLRETEHQLLFLNRDLERRVQERTVALRETQQSDRANWERLRSIIGHLSIGVLANDEHGKVLEVNEEYCRLWNDELKPEEVIGQDIWRWSDVFRRYITDFDRHAAALREHSRRRKPLHGEILYFTNGRCIQRDFLPIFEEGKYVGEIYLYRDVTQERRADAFKSEFMSLASHQLRTPLTGIRWSLGRLTKELAGALPERQLRLLENGLSAAKRMSDTIDTMLLISQIESGSAALKREAVRVMLFLQEIVADYDEVIREKGLSVSIDVPADMTLATDAHLLRELMANLIGNAMKYTGEGGRVVIRASHPDEHIRIDVRDTGFGIPLYQQKMIFTKFFRGENVVGRETEGTGLGLYLSSLIAKHLEGTLTFESSAEGTVFTLLLPDRSRRDEAHGQGVDAVPGVLGRDALPAKDVS